MSTRHRFRRVAWRLTLLLAVGACDRAREAPGASASVDRGTIDAPPSAVVTPGPTVPPPASSVRSNSAPNDPAELAHLKGRSLVVLHAQWCQWCERFEREVLGDVEVRAALGGLRLMEADVDVAPAWMDLPGVTGLPALVFFDASGRQVLSRSGYQDKAALVLLLEALTARERRGELEPDEAAPAPPRLASDPITRETAAETLRRFESAIFMRVNSHDGGFGTPARVPYPDLLRELAEWVAMGAPPRVSAWVEHTLQSALRGESPRLEGQPLADMDFGADELRRLSKLRLEAGPRWAEGIERLPERDPYRGLQDPVDHGVFRYCAGPGWYHPHFERSAADNLSWALTLRALGREARAIRILRFVDATFVQGGLLGAVQRADPFYFRLREIERRSVSPPRVASVWRLDVQARWVRAEPRRCSILSRLAHDRWPRLRWTERGEDTASSPAPADVMGELFLALAACREAAPAALSAELAARVVSLWAGGDLPSPGRVGRLHRLAAGICAALPPPDPRCGRALSTIRELPLDLAAAPPLTALAAWARGGEL